MKASKAALMEFGLATAPVLLYGAAVALGIRRNVDQINPDGICYLRQAQELVAGHGWESVSSYWSPLLSWSLVPFLAGKVDGLLAARLALAGWGAVLVLAAVLFTRRFTTLSPAWRLLTGSLVAVMAACWAVRFITPDVIVAALLLLYLWTTTAPDLLQGRWRPILCGMFGGLAFLGKAYALPFVLVHFPLALILRHAWSGGVTVGPRAATFLGRLRRGTRTVAPAWALGLLAFAVVAGPWIGVLSHKYGRFTCSSAGWLSHAIMAPDNPPGFQPHFDAGLWEPAPGHLTVWETVDGATYADWSPLASVRNAAHQTAITIDNIWALQHMLAEFDYFAFSLATLGGLPLLWLLWRQRRDNLFRLAWIAATVATYCGGYMLVHCEERYIVLVVYPLLCAFGLYVWCTLLGSARASWPQRDGATRWLGRAGAAVLIVSFAIPAAIGLTNTIVGTRAGSFRAAGQELQQLHCQGPIASTRFHEGLYVAYHANLPFLGAPLAREVEPCAAELGEHHVGTFLVWDDSPLARNFATSPAWRLAGALDCTGEEGPAVIKVRVFVPIQ